MIAASWPRARPLDERLLVIDAGASRFDDAHVRDLPGLLGPGDLLVLNDAATLPASLQGTNDAGAPIEARLAAPLGELDDARFTALLFGAGDWRTRTEERPPPPHLAEGDTLRFGPELTAIVGAPSPRSDRIVELTFEQRGDRFWTALYRRGRPIQYAYVAAPLALHHVQTRYAARPWCAELPSAGRPLTWGLLSELARRGVRVASVTHAAGISSTGDPTLDALLPLPERFEIPRETAFEVRSTKAAGGRVIAVGTTVARALEGAAAQHDGELVAGAGITDLVLGRGGRRRVVDGLFTGMHDPTESHYRLLGAFAPEELLRRAHTHAQELGYLCHEFGDSSLILH